MQIVFRRNGATGVHPAAAARRQAPPARGALMTASPRERVFDLCARALVCALFTMLSVRLLADFLNAGRVIGLLLVAWEELVVVLTIVRRRGRVVGAEAGGGDGTVMW